MKRILTILAGLMLAVSAQAANFTAAQGGDWHTTNTWGVTSVPGASDNVSLNAEAVTMTGTVTCASLIKSGTGGSLDFGTNASFTCRAVTNAPLTTSAAGVVVDCDVTLTTSNGFTISTGGVATIAGTWNNSGSGYAVYNNSGTVTDFSGTLNNSGSGYGVCNSAGTWTDFTGTLNNSGAFGVFNIGTLSDFSGTLNNSGDGYGAYNWVGSTWTDFSGNLVLSSANVEAIGGDAIPFSGSIKIAAQADLSAANIVVGKTILGVTGTKAAGYGINGTGLLGASW
jgi:hypothetical protein